MGEWCIWAKSSRDSRVLSGCSELVSLLVAPVVGICTLPLPTCSREFSYLNYTARSTDSLSRLLPRCGPTTLSTFSMTPAIKDGTQHCKLRPK